MKTTNATLIRFDHISSAQVRFDTDAITIREVLRNRVSIIVASDTYTYGGDLTASEVQAPTLVDAGELRSEGTTINHAPLQQSFVLNIQ